MTDDRDICERLEDTSYDGAFAMRREAAKLIRALRYYADWLEDKLREVGLEAERFREHVAKQQLDIITLGQEVGRLREASKKAYQDSLDAVEKIKSDVFTDLGKHHKSAFGSATAKDWMIAIAEDIQREITARAVLAEEKK